MGKALRNHTEIQEGPHGQSSDSIDGADTKDGTSIFKDADTMPRTIVLLITCLALAALAHVIVY
jgi:hypothetical protein